MALQVWLPLNGNLNQQGLSHYNLSMFRGSEVYNDAGKIGKCFYSNGVNTIKILDIIPDFYNYTGYSLCAWFYIESNNTSHSGSAIISGGNWNNQLLNLALSDWSTDHYTRLQVSGTSWNKVYNYNFMKNTWYHVVVCSDSDHTYAYVNGVLIGDTVESFLPTNIEGNDICIGGATYYSGMQFFGKINDVRIYDHCLSPREVSELAKGLVAHYPLNDSYIEPTTNLCTTQAGGWNNSGTCVRNTDDTSILNKPTPAPVYSLTATSDGSMAISLGSTTANLPSKTLVASVYCWLDGTQDSQTVYLRSQSPDGSVGYLMYNGDSNPLTWPKKRWIRLVSSPITTASNATTFYICTYVNKNTEVRAFNGWQIEENTHVTDWVAPGTTRAASTTVFDTSGFGYNGEINTAMTVSDNTARYSRSTIFDGVGNCIKVPFNDMLGTTLCDYTLSFWVRKDVLGSKGYQTMFGGPSGYELEARRGDNHEFQLYSWGGSYTAYEFGEWYHLAFVHSTTEVKLYVNGEAKISGGTPKANPSGNYYIGAWNSVTQQNFQGQMSDFRIYATALTADQVKDLYQTSASLANNGTLFSYEFTEV